MNVSDNTNGFAGVVYRYKKAPATRLNGFMVARTWPKVRSFQNFIVALGKIDRALELPALPSECAKLKKSDRNYYGGENIAPIPRLLAIRRAVVGHYLCFWRPGVLFRFALRRL